MKMQKSILIRVFDIKWDTAEDGDEEDERIKDSLPRD